MLNPTEITAIDKMIKGKDGKEARDLLSVSTHPVDCTVRIQGSIKVGADYEKNVTASLPQKKMLLAALMLSGVSVKAFIKRYNDREFTVSKEQEGNLDAIWKELADNSNKTVKGAVTTQLKYTIEAVEEATEAVEATTETIEA